MYFPNDADATLAYVTPIKNSIADNRLTDYLQSTLTTACGKKIFAFQKFAFKTKAALLDDFYKYTQDQKLVFTRIKAEKVFEYLLLEYPFAFYQNCFDCKLIPDTTATTTEIVAEIVFSRFAEVLFRCLSIKTRTFVLYVLPRTRLLRVQPRTLQAVAFKRQLSKRYFCATKHSAQF